MIAVGGENVFWRAMANVGRWWAVVVAMAMLVGIDAVAQAPVENGDGAGCEIRVTIVTADAKPIAATAVVWRYSLAGAASVEKLDIPADGCVIANVDNAAM